MKNIGLILILVGFSGVFLTSCKSEFEKIRSSGDADSIMKKAFDYYEQEEWSKAQSLFELAIGVYKGRVEAEKAYFYYAYTHYHQGKYILGAYYFRTFSSTFPNSEYREESDFMESFANYQLSPNYRLDQTYTEKAINGLQLFVNTYPTSERVTTANQLIDEMRSKLEKKAYGEAELYYDLRQYQSATQSYENLLKDFPDTKQVELVKYMMIKSYYDLAENSIFTKQEERYRSALKSSTDFIEKFPESTRLKDVISIQTDSNNKLKEIQNVGY